jgi:hypothetical protein
MTTRSVLPLVYLRHSPLVTTRSGRRASVCPALVPRLSRPRMQVLHSASPLIVALSDHAVLSHGAVRGAAATLGNSPRPR